MVYIPKDILFGPFEGLLIQDLDEHEQTQHK
jgi:hypothetical protein